MKCGGGKKAAGTSVERKPRSTTKSAEKEGAASRRQSKSAQKGDKKGTAAARSSKSKDAKGDQAMRSKSKDNKGGKASASGKGAASAKKGKKDQGKASARSKTPAKGGKEESKYSFWLTHTRNLGKSAKKKKEEKEEDDGALKPTRALSAYIFYSNVTIPKLKADEGLSHKDAMGKAGKLWNDLSEEAKKPYNKLHEEDVVR